MKTISKIRYGLEDIPGALSQNTPPEAGREGDSKALPIYQPDNQLTEDRYSEIRNYPNPDSKNDGFDPIPYFEILPEIEKEEVERRLSKEVGNDIKKSVEILGIDAHGWYVSFHYTGSQWGIYIPKSQIMFFAVTVFGKLGCSLNKCMELAFRSILRHELCHFYVDFFISQMELIAGRPCYFPSRILWQSNLGYFFDEEQIANAWMLRGLRYPEKRVKERGALDCLRNYTLLQPPGYKEGYRIIENNQFMNAVEDLGYNYLSKMENQPGCHLVPLDFYELIPFNNRDAWKYCPIHVLDDTAKYGLPNFDIYLFPKILNIIESNNFLRKLNRLSSIIKRKWNKVKTQLADSTALRSLDFKPFPKAGKNLYSVRVGQNFRAHLRVAPNEQHHWFAEKIGTHTEMGHD